MPEATPVDVTPQPEGAAPEGAAAADPVAAALASPQFAAMLNRAITSHLSRPSTVGALAQALGAKLQPAPPAPADGAAPGAGAQPAQETPGERKLREKLEILERRYQEASEQAKASEKRAREDKARADLRAALTAKGVRPELLDAAQVLLENRALRWHDGVPSLVVKRARAKGATPEELEYEDLAAGVEDWLADPASAVYLPPPTPLARGGGGPAPVGGRKPIVVPKSGQAVDAEAALADYLARGGAAHL